MALSVFKGSFTQKTSTGSQGYTGVGFQPKALIIFGNLLTANGVQADAVACIGLVASSSDRRYTAYADDDAVSVTIARRRWSNDKALGLINPAGTLLCEADFTSFDSDGFTLNWGTADATARVFHYIAIGGTNITNVAGGEQTRPTSTGSQSVTAPGFLPTVGFFTSCDASATGNLTDAHLSLGFASDSTNEGVIMAQSAHDLGDSEASRYHSSTATIGSHNTSSGSGLRALADFTSYDTNGFTLNWSTVNANAYYYNYLVIKGGFAADVLAWTKITTTGSDAKTGVGFQPKLTIHMGNQSTATGSATQAIFSLGAATGASNRGTIAFASQTAQATSRADSDNRTDSTLDFMTYGTPGTATINDRADHTSFDTDGFTVNWGTSSASARRVLTLSIGKETQDLAPSAIATAEAFGTHSIAAAGGGTQTITATAIATAEAFGTAKFGHYLLPSAIDSATAFGTAVLTPGVVTLLPSAITTGEAFGTHTVTPGVAYILPSAIASAEAFGTASMGLYILPSGITTGLAFGTATLTPGVVTLAPSAIASAEAFGTAKMGLYLLPSAIASAEAFGTAVLTPGTAYIVPTAIATAEAFGTHTVTPGVVYLLPTGISSTEAFGTASLSAGATTISPSAIASAEAFGTASLGFIIYPSGIATGAAFGTAVTTPGTAYILPSGIASATAFGTAVIAPGVAYILPSGISTAEAFGTLAISNGVQFLVPSGITTGEAFGTHTVTPGVAYILPSGITTANAFGTAVIVPGAVIITPLGITTGETFGSHTLTPGAVTLLPSGITTGETFGTASLGFILYPSAIATAEAFGTHTLTPGTAYILPTGIATAEAFGTLWIATAAGVPFIILHAVQRTEPYTAGTRRFLLNANARQVEFEAFERVFVFHARKTQDFE